MELFQELILIFLIVGLIFLIGLGITAFSMCMWREYKKKKKIE